MSQAKIEYVEASLDEVVRFFTNNFKSLEPASLQCLDVYVDAGKGKVIFKMLSTPIDVPMQKEGKEIHDPQGLVS